MRTKTKGDILAERIEAIKSDFDGLQGLSEILGEALADYYAPEVDPYAELKAAFKAGKVIQTRRSLGCDWTDWHISYEPTWTSPVENYRIKPAPKLVPLGPEDVPIGSACRLIGKESWSVVNGCGKDGITCGDRIYSFENMKLELEINRNDGRGFVRCEKEAK